MPKPDAFVESSEAFTNNKKLPDAYLDATFIAENKHSAVLLSSIGAKPYNILHSLTAPNLPSSKTYADLWQSLQSHYCPKPLEIVEPFKFHKRCQEAGESVADFIAVIKRLFEHCKLPWETDSFVAFDMEQMQQKGSCLIRMQFKSQQVPAQ